MDDHNQTVARWKPDDGPLWPEDMEHPKTYRPSPNRRTPNGRTPNPNGPNVTEDHAPNPDKTAIVKRRKSRGHRLEKKSHPERYIKGSPKWQRAERLRRLAQIRKQAVTSGLVEHGLKPWQVLQRLIDDAFIDYATEQADINHREQQGKPITRHRLLKLRRDAAYYASLALQYNIADRQTSAMEAQTQMFATLLQMALRDPEINLTERKIRKIPALIEAKARELQQVAHSYDPTQDADHVPPHQFRNFDATRNSTGPIPQDRTN